MEDGTVNPFRVENWKAYYINLDKRTDRKASIESELNKQGIPAERFSAMTDESLSKFPELKLNSKLTIMPVHYGQELAPRNYVKGEWGCTCSHYSLLTGHLNFNSQKILAIFEDDAHFCSDFRKRLEYLENHFNLEWDIFYLNGTCQLLYDQKTNVKFVWKIKDVVYGTHSMLINPKSIPKILKLMQSFAPNVAAIDCLYNYLIPHLNMYCFVPGMVSQHSSPGNIGNRDNVTDHFINTYGPHTFTENLDDYNSWENLKVVTRNIFYSKTYFMRAFLKNRLPAIYKGLKTVKNAGSQKDQ